MGRRIARMDDTDDVEPADPRKPTYVKRGWPSVPEHTERARSSDITRREGATRSAVSRRTTGGCSQDAYFLNR